MDADGVRLEAIPLSVAGEMPLMDVGYLMTGLDLTSIAVWRDEAFVDTLRYEEVARGLRTATEETSVGHLVSAARKAKGSATGPSERAENPEPPGEESLAAIAADVLLPTQFFEGTRHPDAGDPERRLMSAVLELGIRDYRILATGEDASRRSDWNSVHGWLEERNARWLFSFENICNVLGIDADAVRGRLCRLRDETLGGAATGEPSARRRAG